MNSHQRKPVLPEPQTRHHLRVMNTTKPLVILALLTLASLTPWTLAQEPDPDRILEAVRRSTVQNEQLTLAGRLRHRESGKRHPFRMTVRRNQIAFLFEQAPQHTIVLDLGGERYRLREKLGNGGFVDVPAAKYGTIIRNTGVNYLDISLAYLYWPNAKFLKEDVVSERITWLLRVPNPDPSGPYATLDIWVDQQTGGLMRIQGYDRQGRLVKKMEVMDVQRVKAKDKKVWALEKMKILSIDPNTRRVTSLTYMEL